MYMRPSPTESTETTDFSSAISSGRTIRQAKERQVGVAFSYVAERGDRGRVLAGIADQDRQRSLLVNIARRCGEHRLVVEILQAMAKLGSPLAV